MDHAVGDIDQGHPQGIGTVGRDDRVDLAVQFGVDGRDRDGRHGGDLSGLPRRGGAPGRRPGGDGAEQLVAGDSGFGELAGSVTVGAAMPAPSR